MTNVMIVEDDPSIAILLQVWAARLRLRTLWACSTREAMEMIDDICFIDIRLDGILVDYRLPDATGCRVLMEFLKEFPSASAAVMTAYSDLTLEPRLRTRSIPLFRKPLNKQAIENWLGKLSTNSKRFNPDSITT